ncbi:MAG: hypothetical protein CML22_06955 [Rheinheimera sp.]|nr:hypothetical protein [Rheinheimera sp.]MBM34022.1 hypothetical protein [Rheinheimera sp.]|tara:strand:+ start:3766 stop:4425 length:660 start_codon:yes stop_codon:yes gene_type:complete
MAKSTTMFERVTTLLLSGKVLCQASFSDEFLWLVSLSGTNLDEINQYLGKLNRTVRQTQDEQGFYCSYVDHSTDSAFKDIRSQFTEIVQDLEPLIHWLSLVQSITGSERPISAGDIIAEGDLLSSIEAIPDYEVRLMKVTDAGVFKSTQSEPKKRLSALLGKLRDKEYLIQTSTTGSKFIATAKWSLVYETMAFIAAHQSIPTDSEQEEYKRIDQMELI